MQSMDQALRDLYKADAIDLDTAMRRAHNVDELNKLIHGDS